MLDVEVHAYEQESVVIDDRRDSRFIMICSLRVGYPIANY